MLSPPFCVHCKIWLDERRVLCDTCYHTIRPIISTTLTITPNYSIPVYAIGAYEGILAHMICAKQYGSPVYARQLGALMAHASLGYQINQSGKNSFFDIVTSVPLHWRRYAYRGYNQSEEIAVALIDILNKRQEAYNNQITYIPLVKRMKHTKPQSESKAWERAQNVKDVFALNYRGPSLAGRHITLIDDVMTTGATLRAVAKELLALQPASLNIYVVARTDA